IAGATKLSAAGVDALDRGDTRQCAFSPLRNHIEFQPRNVIGIRARCIAGGFADNNTAVGQFPAWAGIVAAAGLALDAARGDGLAELPRQFAISADFAFVDLRAFGMRLEDRRFPWRGD